MNDVKENSVQWTDCDSNRECLKFDKAGKHSSSTKIITVNFISASYRENALPAIHIKIHHTSCQILEAKPVLSSGLILLRYSEFVEFVSNKHPNVPSVPGPCAAVGLRNNVPAGPPSHRPCYPVRSINANNIGNCLCLQTLGFCRKIYCWARTSV